MKTADARFLLDVLDLPDALRHRLEADHVELSDDDADELRDLCGERLQSHGFGPSYAPTEEGRRLEELINALYVG